MIPMGNHPALTHAPCATAGCLLPSIGRSKHCRVHRAEARGRWVARVAVASADRSARYARFAELYSKAQTAADIAADTITDRLYCGCSWITVSPGNSSFARWLLKEGHARKASSGVRIPAPGPTAVSHARAMAMRGTFEASGLFTGSKVRFYIASYQD